MCDIAYLIKDHVTALMQVLTVELREYDMQLVTTKCLNTAVMMMYLLLGKRALDVTRHCDVRNVTKRHQSTPVDRGDTIRTLHEDAMTPGKRALFYFMITDGPMCREPLIQTSRPSLPRAVSMANGVAINEPHRDGAPPAAVGGKIARAAPEAVATAAPLWWTKPNAAPKLRAQCPPGARCPGFPGHVLVIERLPPPRRTYNVYQSYIYHYDLSEHIDAAQSVSMGRAKMNKHFESLAHVLSSPTWDQTSCDAWMKFTHTPAEHARKWLGCSPGPRTMLPCYVKVETDVCITMLSELLRDVIAKLQAHPDPDTLYGQPWMFPAGDVERGDAPRPPPLTVRAILAQLTTLADKLA
jgi:hypothetical protein